MGYIVPEYYRWPGDLSSASLTCRDVWGVGMSRALGFKV